MKKRVICLLAVCLLLSGCAGKAWNGTYRYNHVTMAQGLDETDICAMIGAADYVFLAEVTKASSTISDVDGGSEYTATVTENFKGELVGEVTLRKPGGYLRDGTLVLFRSDRISDTLLPPEAGKSYFFLAYAQHDGSLLLTEFYANVEYTDESQIEAYREYVKHEIPFSRERFRATWDAANAI